MNIRFLAPCTSEITAEARVIKTWRSPSPVSVDMYDTNRTHIAVAQVTDILGLMKPGIKAE
ncbi:MAG: hypothetical protein WBM78_09845 [Desulfobacterales bacterium]